MRARIPAAIWALGLVSMFMDISSEMIHSLLPMFLATSLGVSATAIGLIAAIAMMLWVLFRLLNNRYPLQRAGHYYHTTFRVYMLAILLAFGAVTAALFV